MVSQQASNMDKRVARAFGEEWRRFDQSGLSAETLGDMFEDYFREFPWADLPADPVGADFGCGSGRWALRVAPRVKKLYCVDASIEALEVARRNLIGMPNCEFISASIGDMPLSPESLDFGYSLGVLHHVPDTAAGLASCVRTLKPGAPFLLYLYYALENRPAWYRALWSLANIGRTFISRLPSWLRHAVGEVIAAVIYWPLARAALVARGFGIETRNFPLQFYSDKPFYVLRTDALDRFGTRLERRLTRAEIQALMCSAGPDDISFSERRPFWCAVGYRRAMEQ